jgi:RNA polymerase sigma-70 factor (ECF subfamily)
VTARVRGRAVAGDVPATLERAFRDEGPRVLATLIRHVGDFALAEDALQDAWADAATAWPRDGVPRNPGAWLTVAARRRAVDRLRRDRARRDRTDALERLMALGPGPDDDPVARAIAADPPALQDDRLRLVFTCCHPALALEARVALTLRALGGLTTAEVARAFLVPEATMAQRLVRAKRKIAAAGIPYRVPPSAELPERVAGVLRVVYLVFTEGHQASSGPALGRPDLGAEALRLARLLASLLPDDAEVAGLLALLALTDARRPARVDDAGRYVALEGQDRTRWDAELVAEGRATLEAALRLRRPGPYQLQAAIAALHAEAPTWEATDWRQIAALYGELARLSPSPVVEVNRAVAVAMAQGPQAGLAVLERVSADRRMAGYQPLHAARAELLRRSGDAAGADAAYAQAIALSANAVERDELRRRRAALPPTRAQFGPHDGLNVEFDAGASALPALNRKPVAPASAWQNGHVCRAF